MEKRWKFAIAPRQLTLDRHNNLFGRRLGNGCASNDLRSASPLLMAAAGTVLVVRGPVPAKGVLGSRLADFGLRPPSSLLQYLS